MIDLIDRKALLKQIEIDSEDSPGWYRDTWQFMRTIDQMPSVDIPQWIPCSERMPEYRKTVLISTFWGVKTGFLDGTEAYGDFWEIIEDDATAALHSIYAWMPLPKPWIGAEDAK